MITPEGWVAVWAAAPLFAGVMGGLITAWFAVIRA
jgi:hypothetical protein